MDRSQLESNPAIATAHASGPDLFAVAEGSADAQPSEAVLGHIFGCASCSATVREIRAGLSAFAVAAPRRPEATVAAAAPAPDRTPTSLATAPEVSREDAATLLAADASGDDGEARSRRMILKVVAIGIVLVIALVWMRSFAAGLR